jgi:hypothetical protein
MRFVLPFAVAAIAAATVTVHAAPPPEIAKALTEAGAASGTTPALASGPDLAVPIAFASNVPLAWPWSVGVSAWVGVDDHHAIRANFARYRGPIWLPIAAAFSGEGSDLEEGDIPPDFGHTTDASLGWVTYPRRVLDGATIEVGALLRLNRLRDRIDSKNVASEEQFTNVYGARALIGWTWRLGRWWFLATSIGASAGYERGREKVFVGYDAAHGNMEIIREGRVSRVAVSAEAYLRIGLVIGQ